jgi:hypothetical protein
MAHAIRVHASQNAADRYRELLRSDYTKETLESTLALLWATIQASTTPAGLSWQKSLEYDEMGRASGKSFDQAIIDRIRIYSTSMGKRALPGMPRTFSERPTRSAALAEKTWAYLAIQTLAKLEGDTDFFNDLQSILYLCSVEYLLSHLKTQSMTAEHNCLVNAMYLHTVFVWSDLQPAHMFYLQSALMDYLGHPQKRSELLHRSLMLTDREDHSYLTKMQALVFDLVDSGQQRKAMDLLLSALRKEETGENALELVEMAKHALVSNGK